jgi:hypothetical protein
VVSQPSSDKGRELWWSSIRDAWNNVKDRVTDAWGNVKDRVKDAWNSWDLDETFEDIKDALEPLVQVGIQFLRDIGSSVRTVWNQVRALGDGILDGFNPNGDLADNMRTIIDNVRQVTNCDTDTFEVLVHVKCDADLKALEAEVLQLWNNKTAIANRIQSVDVVDVHDPCTASGVHRTEIEFDIKVKGDGVDSDEMLTFIKDVLKPELGKASNWDIAAHPTLAPYLPQMDANYAFDVARQPDFCEAWNAGVTEFSDAVDTIQGLRTIVSALQGQYDKALADLWFWMRPFFRFNKQAELDEATTNLQKAESAVEHGADVALGALSQCAKGQSVGPKIAGGARFCNAHPNRLLQEQRIFA